MTTIDPREEDFDEFRRTDRDHELETDVKSPCDGYAGDPGASAPRCESYRGHSGRHFIRPVYYARTCVPVPA